jgi:hypothetical protein
MERIDAAQARDHIEMIDRILAESQQRLCSGGEYFVVWGVASAFATICSELIVQGIVARVAVWSIPAVLIAAAVFSALRGRSQRHILQRNSLIQREFFNVVWLALGLAFIANLAVHRIFAGMASAAVWSVAESIILLYIGMHGNRRAQIAGVLVVVSMVVANYAPPNIAGYVLGAGMLFGYGGFGLTELLARD